MIEFPIFLTEGFIEEMMNLAFVDEMNEQDDISMENIIKELEEI